MQTLADVLNSLDTHTYTERMPVLFVGHGNPLNAINDSAFSKTWKDIGAHLPVPKAIVCMSAHWLTNGTYASKIAKPELIYDFYGFPPELYAVKYLPPGEPSLADTIATMTHSHTDAERGLDHGVWTVLVHLFPTAHIPVIQVGIDYEHSRRSQYELMQLLKPLRDKGILFIGSGNIVHNLGLMRMSGEYDWATEFDAVSKKLIAERNTDALIDIEKHSNIASLAVPTDDHYRPMLNTLALMDADESVAFFNEEIDLGSVSMRSFISGFTH